MKLRSNISKTRAGMLLIECLVYLTVSVILLGLGTAAFYFCWDRTDALMEAANGVESALRVGERWRADVRAATGKISVETTDAGEVVKIPEGRQEIVYRFAAGQVRRQIGASARSETVLPQVKSSQITMEPRGGVTAWRWELQLTQRRREAHLPMRFTFEAAQRTP
jgi:hypothetical protein